MTRKGEGDSMKKLKMSIAVSLALVCGGVPVLSDAGTLTGGATMPEQIVQEGTAIEQLMKQAEAVQLQIQQVTDAAQNLEQVPNQMWQPAAQDLNQLAQIESQAQGLSMAGQNISSTFAQQYPQYSSTSASTIGQYQQWSQNLLNSTQGALATQNMSTQDFQNNAQSLQTIENEPVSGRLQALQVGNQIAGNVATSLQQLGTMAAAQMHAQDAYMANRQQSQNASVSNNQKWATTTEQAVQSGNPYNG